MALFRGIKRRAGKASRSAALAQRESEKIKMLLPEIKKRVLAWVEGEEYPFVGYYNGLGEWCMETSYLNCDNHRNDIFGEVVAWQELPSHPTPPAQVS